MDDGCVSNFPREVVGERKEKWQGSRDRFIGTGGVIFLSHFCNDSGSDVTLGRSVGGVKRSEERREGMCSLGGRKIERAPRSLFLELNQTSVTTLFEYNISSNISAEGPRRIAAGLFQDTYLIPSRDLRPFRDFLLLLFFLFSFFTRPPLYSWLNLALEIDTLVSPIPSSFDDVKNCATREETVGIVDDDRLSRRKRKRKKKLRNRTCRDPAPLTSITLSRDHL